MKKRTRNEWMGGIQTFWLAKSLSAFTNVCVYGGSSSVTHRKIAMTFVECFVSQYIFHYYYYYYSCVELLATFVYMHTTFSRCSYFILHTHSCQTIQTYTNHRMETFLCNCKKKRRRQHASTELKSNWNLKLYNARLTVRYLFSVCYCCYFRRAHMYEFQFL